MPIGVPYPWLGSWARFPCAPDRYVLSAATYQRLVVDAVGKRD
jgi:hypothetical protein